MTVVYDLQATQSVLHGERGIARYVLDLAISLEVDHPGTIAAFAFNPDLAVPTSVHRAIHPGKLVAVDDPAVGRCDVFHVASPMENGIALDRLFPPSVRRGGAAVVATVYDLIPLRFPEAYLAGGRNRCEYQRGVEILRAADHLLAISQATADDVQSMLGVAGRRITVIGGGAGAQFAPLDTLHREGAWRQLAAALPRLRPGYVLVPTGIDHRKNVGGTIEAFAMLPAGLRREHQLVVVCRVSDEVRRSIETRCIELGIADEVVLTGYVSDETLVRLYQLTTVVLFPSLYEGFGLPPLEARRCGAPVLCGDNSSLREVITDPNARFPADDPAAIARVLKRSLVDRGFLSFLSSLDLPPLTWAIAADRTVDVYRDLNGAVRQPRLR